MLPHNGNMMSIKNSIAYGAIIGMSAALLWHFSAIWRYGQYLVGEPNILIRSLETALLLAFWVFGINKLIGDVRSED